MPPGSATAILFVFHRISFFRKQQKDGDGVLFAAAGLSLFKLTTQADSHSSSCFGSRRWGAYLRRNDRTNSLTSRDSSLALMITDVSNHNDVSESGFTSTPSA